MKKAAALIFVCSVSMSLIVASGCSAGDSSTARQTQQEPGPADTVSLSRGTGNFAIDLYVETCRNAGQDNVFFSPFSISSALAMAYSGARGETAEDMQRVLGFDAGPQEVGAEYKPLMEELSSVDQEGSQRGEPFTLSIANGMWVNQGFQILESYRNDMIEDFQAEVGNLDFTGDPMGSRETINSWVEEKTRDRIQDLIPPGLLGSETRLVLTNAVYFKASWDRPFDEAATRDEQFRLADGSVVQVPTMHQTEPHRYCTMDGCSAVELMYSGGRASMLVILPDGDMEDFQDSFDAAYLQSIRENLSSANLTLAMPSFQFTRTISLGSLLVSMGMESAFSDRADFSGITGGMDLFISQVLHKAFVKVDEAGTEAAAATALVMNTTSMPPPPAEMRIDRPFLFLILDNRTDTILFMGRVMDPRG